MLQDEDIRQIRNRFLMEKEIVLCELKSMLEKTKQLEFELRSQICIIDLQKIADYQPPRKRMKIE
jgi:hypothetical protein